MLHLRPTPRPHLHLSFENERFLLITHQEFSVHTIDFVAFLPVSIALASSFMCGQKAMIEEKSQLCHVFPGIDFKSGLSSWKDQPSSTYVVWVDPSIKFVWSTLEDRLWSDFISNVELSMYLIIVCRGRLLLCLKELGSVHNNLTFKLGLSEWPQFRLLGFAFGCMYWW